MVPRVIPLWEFNIEDEVLVGGARLCKSDDGRFQVPFQKHVLPAQFDQIGQDSNEQRSKNERDDKNSKGWVIKQAPTHGFEAVNGNVQRLQNGGDEQVEQTHQQHNDHGVDELAQDVMYGVGDKVPSATLALHQSDIGVLFQMAIG